MSALSRHRLCLLLAILGWSGLAIQLELVLFARWQSGASVVGGLVSYFSFFTILTNTLAASVLTCAADTPVKSQGVFLATVG